jgi:hypothetical protein
LARLTGVHVSAALVRRLTEAVGATAVAQADAEVAHLEQTLPPPPVSPERLVLGADGAMVPLVGGEWAEVKLVSIGEPVAEAAAVRTQHVTYFARLADAATFTTQALGELHRRGVETADVVAAVQDGAVWLQGFVDVHRPDAVRILDWPHACEHLQALVEHLFGSGTARTQRVVARLRSWLWEHGPTRVLAVLDAWQRVRPAVAREVAYFRDRQAQMDYPAFRAAGWPVGSGATESGHKQVMQARLKGAGMHWARSHVNPLLALCLLECNARWDTEQSSLWEQHRRAGVSRQRHQAQRSGRRGRRSPPPAGVAPLAPPLPASPVPPLPAPRLAPTTGHPWRRYGVPLSPKL